jgi:RNA polymerase-binding transcription factor DksA
MKTKPNGPSAAKACDILGQPVAQETVPAAWRHHHARLLQLRNHLFEDVDELGKNARAESSPFSVHMGDAATDSFDRDLALSLLAVEHNAVGEIDDALQRIREGRYGVCEFTGKVIPRQRLEAIPWARYTVEAQAELERRGEAPRVHLNKLESIEPERLEAQ